MFGSSNEVLGAIESGTDFERRITDIYQKYRTQSEIQSSLDQLQQELSSEIDENLKRTRQQLLENFDEEVQEKLRVRLKESSAYLRRFENWLWSVTKIYLKDYADFISDEFSFTMKAKKITFQTV